MEPNPGYDRARLIRLKHPRVLLEHEAKQRKEMEREIHRQRNESAKRDIGHTMLIEMAAERSAQVI